MCKAKKIICFLAFVGVVSNALSAQEYNLKTPAIEKEYVRERGEVILQFLISDHVNRDTLARRLSVDRVSGDTVTAYANEKAFQWFLQQSIPYKILVPPSFQPGIFTLKRQTALDWHTQYPSYAEYINLMNWFAGQYPDICRLTEFGITPGGHKLLALKISDHPAEHEQEPVFLYTSSMHGDELLGFNLMLRLTEYLLLNYNSDPEITDMINNSEIWINPISNPDGAYYVSDLSVSGAVRYNNNQTDLNRNFPDVSNPQAANNNREPETIAMMHFMDSIKPVLAANLHGGSEVVNYPWDSWSTLHADDAWYNHISRNYADTVHRYSPAGYMSFMDNGITNGHEWYSVYGGRQDYTNYFLHGREVTIELSDNKMPPEDQLDNFWNYNRASLLQYIENIFTGIQGVVTDSLTGAPLQARIILLNHDSDNSFVSTDQSGKFYRMNLAGTYHLAVESPGYCTKYVSVTIHDGELVNADAKLSMQNGDIEVYPNPFTDYLSFYSSVENSAFEIRFMDMAGRLVKISRTTGQQGRINILSTDLAPGLYILQIIFNHQLRQFCVTKNP